MRTHLSFLAISLCFCLGGSLFAAGPDWPQWRGPDRTGIAPAKNLLTQWPKDGPPLVWRNQGLGNGYSSLAIHGDAIFTMGDIGEKQYVVAASRKDGSVLWKTEVGKAWVDQYGGTRSTPTYNDNHIYSISTEGLLTCLAAKTGKVVWKKHLKREFGGFMAAGNDWEWKFSESPLVDGDRVVVTPGSKDALIVALNKKTGAEIWRTKQPDMGEKGADGAAYASIVIGNALGIKQYVTLTGRGAVGIAAADGKFLWGYNRIANKVANIPTPIVEGNHVFVSTGYGTGAALLEIVREGDGTAAKEVYFLEANKMQNHHGGMIYHKGHIFAGTAHNKGFPICLDMKSGDIKWGPVRNEGKGSAALSMADGHLYFRYQNGLMVLVEATTDEYREKGSFMIPEVKNFSWSHPVIAGDKLYLREQDKLYCYDLKRK
ncbi:PQQ-like beta-propeller repeat protein [Sulfidibacter corallicola]|uniref:PQQ-like beta-propeller repeat protein n=1 Tax=Sulfidibacter corallicola TaxID=2818388 RepID=A0A8A4TCI1_SULCO|nr:PQQ-binding-like beta-propeller repeat protein [Sulfidibacter corallicola]QTD47809.1 PQQ-like beta-propeller repeat protein [Sulfidibacter corallicola]